MYGQNQNSNSFIDTNGRSCNSGYCANSGNNGYSMNPSYPGGNNGMYGMNGNRGNYYPAGNNGYSYPARNNGYNYPAVNRGNSCPNGNRGTSSSCPNNNGYNYPSGNNGYSYPVGNNGYNYPAGNNGYYNPSVNRGNTCPNGNCMTTTEPVATTTGPVATTTEPVANPSSSGVTSYQLCSDGECHRGGDGNIITITNYANAKDPTYDQLIAFLKADKTDEHPYTSNYICTEFAKTLHDNAEKNGIKCAFIGCDFSDKYIGHAFNMFKTTDRGIVYIDNTGIPSGSTYEDKILSVEVGKPLTGRYLFKAGSPGEQLQPSL